MKKILFCILSIASSLAIAKPYGEGGCGLGSIVMGKDGNQVLAATSNATGVQVFAISSGTSNCVEDGAVKTANAVPLFIEVNRVALANDAARGEGEALSSLAALLHCDAKALGATLKSNYSRIFEKTEMRPEGIEFQLDSVLSSQPSRACGV